MEIKSLGPEHTGPIAPPLSMALALLGFCLSFKSLLRYYLPREFPRHSHSPHPSPSISSIVTNHIIYCTFLLLVHSFILFLCVWTQGLNSESHPYKASVPSPCCTPTLPFVPCPIKLTSCFLSTHIHKQGLSFRSACTPPNASQCPTDIPLNRLGDWRP